MARAVDRARDLTMGGIVVVGSASGDLVVRHERPPEIGETVFGSSFHVVPGGKGLNQAIAAARAGGNVTFVGAVGDDEYGRLVRDTLEQAGADTGALATLPGVATGTAHISVFDGGDNAIVVVPAANAAVRTLDDDARSRIRAADYVLAQFERPQELVRDAFEEARAAGARTVLTPAPVLPIDDELLELVDILVPNAVEARRLAGVDDDERAAIHLSRRVGLVVLTQGERGSLVARNGVIESRTPARVVDVVDTTAAGDTFVGALAAWLSHGSALGDAIVAATAAASLCVTAPGASPSIPDRERIESALAADRARSAN